VKTTIRLISLASLLIISAFAYSAYPQSTAFLFQGNLSDSDQPADGNYDFEFRLFDQSVGGNQVGPTVPASGIQVSGGSLSAVLDFGVQFPGTARWLEISVRPAAMPKVQDSLGGYTVLAPRHPIASVPYAMRSTSSGMADNASQLGGVAAAQFVVTTDPRLSDARPPTAGSGDYIQNGLMQQPSSNFFISGVGEADYFDASHYRIGGNQVLSTPTGDNTYVGVGTGLGATGMRNTLVGRAAGTNMSGGDNTFLGYEAGHSNASGYENTFLGKGSGRLNEFGLRNTFIGFESGINNYTGVSNTFVGRWSGFQNTGGDNNTFVGKDSGPGNQTGSGNTFLGYNSGTDSWTGNENTFLGMGAGWENVQGSNNTIVGANANVGATNLTNASAIGHRAYVAQNNSLVLGAINGVNGATASTKVGIGTTSPVELFHVAFPDGNILIGDPNCAGPQFAAVGFSTSLTCNNYALLGSTDETMINVPAGGTMYFREGNSTKMRLKPGGILRLDNLGAAGSTQICRNVDLEISTCSSSIRYKTNVSDFAGGIDILDRLRPVTFNWKGSGLLDLGLVAEEVATVDPLLVTYNANGAVEGVKYDRIGVVLVNVVRKQQEEIVDLREQLDGKEARIQRLEAEAAAIRAAFCSQNQNLEICNDQQ